MNKEEFLDNIEEYLNGHLTSAQAAAFEQTLNGDVELQQAFQQRKDTVSALKELFVFESKKEEFRQLLEAMEEEERGKTGKVRPLWPSYLRRVAAILAIALFFGAAYLADQYFTPPNNQQLALTAFEQTADRSLEDISVTMGGTQHVAVEKALMDAKNNYKEGKPKTAIKLLKNIVTANEVQHYKVALLRALCYLKMNKMDAATEQLRFLEQHPANIYEDQVAWYLALIEVYKGKATNIANAKKQLKAIIKQNNSYRDKAQKLLDKL